MFVCFVALRPKSTTMVMEGQSVHLTTTLVNVNAPVVATTSWWWHFYALVVA